jgi:hypothetical protein
LPLVYTRVGLVIEKTPDYQPGYWITHQLVVVFIENPMITDPPGTYCSNNQKSFYVLGIGFSKFLKTYP